MQARFFQIDRYERRYEGEVRKPRDNHILGVETNSGEAKFVCETMAGDNKLTAVFKKAGLHPNIGFVEVLDASPSNRLAVTLPIHEFIPALDALLQLDEDPDSGLHHATAQWDFLMRLKAIAPFV